MTRPWTKEETLEFIKYAKETYTKEDRQNLEKKLRGSAEHGLVKESNIERRKHGFAKHDDDVIGECVEQLWYSDDKMATVVQDALEIASQSYENVKKKGFKDGLKLPEEVDTQLIATSWKQAFTKTIIKHTIPLIEQVCASRSKDGGLCAISEHNYNYFEPNVLHDIIYKGVGVVNKYVPVDIPAIMREMEMMQFNGVFTKNVEANNAYQNCSTVWLKSEHLMPQHQKV
uniref:Uncharacterized protein n=1 Tax=Babesia bovis TaxID=5865 RepID=S6BND0_BABBO|nr:conserved hypothetical protein [Babesia bovis]